MGSVIRSALTGLAALALAGAALAQGTGTVRPDDPVPAAPGTAATAGSAPGAAAPARAGAALPQGTGPVRPAAPVPAAPGTAATAGSAPAAAAPEPKPDDSN